MPQALINFEMLPDQFERLKTDFPELDFVYCTDVKEALGHLQRTHILLAFFLCNRKMLDAAPQLKWVQTISAGVDYVDCEEVRRREILLTNGRGIHLIQMAEYAIASMINLARGFHIMFRNQLQKRWDRDVPKQEIHGATLGILGLGAIGGEVARKAKLMGMRVIGVKRRPEPCESVDTVYGPDQMETVFQTSDYIINLLPHTPATRKIIDRRYFELMKPTACLINIGRGQTVNEDDLIAALEAKRFKAMVSDVFYKEPLPEESRLWELDNVILTPHICGGSPRYVERALDIIRHNLRVYIDQQGEMINRVDLETGY